MLVVKLSILMVAGWVGRHIDITQNCYLDLGVHLDMTWDGSDYFVGISQFCSNNAAYTKILTQMPGL